jgi:hypothetical protein
MVFYPPAWLPAIPGDLSAFGTVGDFVLGGESEPSFNPSRDESPVLVSAQGDRSKTAGQLVRDVENLAAALAQDLKWSPHESGEDSDRAIAILSENTVRTTSILMIQYARDSKRGKERDLKLTNLPSSNTSPAAGLSTASGQHVSSSTGAPPRRRTGRISRGVGAAS